MNTYRGTAATNSSRVVRESIWRRPYIIWRFLQPLFYTSWLHLFRYGRNLRWDIQYVGKKSRLDYVGFFAHWSHLGEPLQHMLEAFGISYTGGSLTQHPLGSPLSAQSQPLPRVKTINRVIPWKSREIRPYVFSALWESLCKISTF